MRWNMRGALAGFIAVLVACASPEEERAQRAAAAQAAVSAESAKAVQAGALPARQTWDEPHLVERLVRAGLAPQSDTARGQRYWGVPVRVYRLGTATLYAYLYRDSLARRDLVQRLDSLTLAPPGEPSPFQFPRQLVVQNNLAAIIVGGTERQQERVALALTAGLPLVSPR